MNARPVLALLCLSAVAAAEDPTPPIAVRLWPGGGVSVEAFDGSVAAVGEVPEAAWASTLKEPARREPAAATVVEVGGRTVLVTHDADELKASPGVPREDVDLLVAPLATSWDGLADVAGGAALVLPASADGRPDDAEVVAHNTLAWSPGEGVRAVALGDAVWEMSGELTALFEAKEAAAAESRETFAGLSAAQMSHRPADGSHTPRWNAEHLRATELLFFSQIYHALDPSVPVLNTAPKQMPADYQEAHPDWSGGREAEEMARVQAFVRRHAYLLDGLDLDEKAPGSRFWTPRRLLEQMVRHYGGHTANVVKKQSAADWPAE